MSGVVIPFSGQPKRREVVITPNPMALGWFILHLDAPKGSRPLGFATDLETARWAGERLARRFHATFCPEVRS